MIQQVSIEVKDLAASRAFYDSALAPLGFACLEASDTFLGYGKDEVRLVVRARTSGASFEASAGVRVGFAARTRAAVKAFYQAALAHGGSGESPPGGRDDDEPHGYAARVRDPDGHRLEALCVDAG